MEKTIKVFKVINLALGAALFAINFRQTWQELQEQKALRAAQAAHEAAVRRQQEREVI